jgi:hypothetical protein
MTQDIQAELRMIREIQSWLRNEERFREEILGVSPSGPGLRPDGLSQSALSQAKPLVPNATTHALKCWPPFFKAILNGSKRHELRRDDRHFRVGDTLRMREFDPAEESYTGRELSATVTYTTADDNPCALSAWGLKEGFCILSIAPIHESQNQVPLRGRIA